MHLQRRLRLLSCVVVERVQLSIRAVIRIPLPNAHLDCNVCTTCARMSWPPGHPRMLKPKRALQFLISSEGCMSGCQATLAIS